MEQPDIVARIRTALLHKPQFGRAIPQCALSRITVSSRRNTSTTRAIADDTVQSCLVSYAQVDDQVGWGSVSKWRDCFVSSPRENVDRTTLVAWMFDLCIREQFGLPAFFFAVHCFDAWTIACQVVNMRNMCAAAALCCIIGWRLTNKLNDPVGFADELRKTVLHTDKFLDEQWGKVVWDGIHIATPTVYDRILKFGAKRDSKELQLALALACIVALTPMYTTYCELTIAVSCLNLASLTLGSKKVLIPRCAHVQSRYAGDVVENAMLEFRDEWEMHRMSSRKTSQILRHFGASEYEPIKQEVLVHVLDSLYL